MAASEEAERIVKEVTEYYGYLDHDMMNDIGRFNADYRRRIDENWLKMENAASHSIKVLARNIYSSGARFVFELLQNAEDNSFRKSDKKNDPPFISFLVHPKRIVVECNEDGFTSLDLKAICSVGESTKTAKHGYVGAKGIGFKSVFIAASRVHIQSGNYSFEFRHNRNDPGFGMVRPIWVTPTDTIPSPLTRTTLYLHDQGNEDEIKHLKMVISMQFDDLQETCLLFLRKIGRISVAFYDGQGNLRRSKQFTKKRIDDYRVSLETTVFSGDKATTTSQIYHITKQLAKGLAQSESRDAATTEEALFTWLKIQQRYLSRVAATFRSPRFQHSEPNLYNQLRAMKVLEVEGISSVLKLSQNGRQYEATLSTASEHIDEPAGNLIIYVPRDRRAQELCFGSVLPRRFATWLMRNPHTNIDGTVEVDIINALTSIFASDRAVLGEILDDQGMIELQFKDPDEDLNEDMMGGEQTEDNDASDSTPEPGHGASDLALTPTHSSVTDASIAPSAVRDSEIEDGASETEGEIFEIQSRASHQVRRGDGSLPRPLRHHSPAGRPSSPEQLNSQRLVPSNPISRATEDQRYQTILERVIAAARFANFPSGEAFDLNDLRDALPDSGEPGSYLSYDGLDVLSRFRSMSQLERDKKVGAAGELYVFELLYKLELPGWGLGNWQSTIRTYANIHPEYADLTRWPNRETADLVYPDTQGDLTRILVDAEILNGDWSIRRPTYFIEESEKSSI
ncbi:hypothetical protein FPRO06_10597 [Fusarium proliferatum]|nr:hypothetical protein FPRO06_10597 [Fusarium proliferatum]